MRDFQEEEGAGKSRWYQGSSESVYPEPPPSRIARTTGSARAGMGRSRVAGGMVCGMWTARGCDSRSTGYGVITWAAAEGGGARHDAQLGTGKGCFRTETRGAGLSGKAGVETEKGDARGPRVHGKVLKGLVPRVGLR